MRRQRQILSCVIALGLLAASLALTQTTPVPQSAVPIHPSALPQQTPPQNSYLEDSANLNKMAIELKQEIDKSSKDQLSLSVIRKAEALEKLAHSLKQRMRHEGAVQ